VFGDRRADTAEDRFKADVAKRDAYFKSQSMHKNKNGLGDMSTGDTPTVAPPSKRRKGNEGAAMLDEMDKMFEPDLDDSEASSVLDNEWATFRTKVTKAI